MHRVMISLSTLGIVSVALSAFAESPKRNEVQFGWIGLFSPQMIEWLGNENAINAHRLCTEPPVEEIGRCVREKLTPKVQVVHLRNKPTTAAASFGALVIVATPGQGLRSYYVPNSGGSVTQFLPDLFDSDFGYGPYFHLTYLERKGDWFQLPEDPMPPGTWMNAQDFGGPPKIIQLVPGEIMRMPRRDVVILSVESDGLRVRLEQPAWDMPCAADDLPPLPKRPEFKIPTAELFSPKGHLLLHVKYTRGC